MIEIAMQIPFWAKKLDAKRKKLLTDCNHSIKINIQEINFWIEGSWSGAEIDGKINLRLKSKNFLLQGCLQIAWGDREMENSFRKTEVEKTKPPFETKRYFPWRWC